MGGGGKSDMVYLPMSAFAGQYMNLSQFDNIDGGSNTRGSQAGIEEWFVRKKQSRRITAAAEPHAHRARKRAIVQH
jgi:hypothetical protein